MMNVFLKVLEMSVTGSVCILSVCLLRLLLKRQPKIFSYVLWGIVGFRLICPIGFESSVSLFGLGNAFQGASVTEQARVQDQNIGVTEWISYEESPDERLYGDGSRHSTSAGVAEVGETQQTAVRSVKALVPVWIWKAAVCVWIGAAFILLLRSMVLSVRLRRLLREAKVCDGYYVVEQLHSPFVFGIWTPKIYLPEKLKQEELSYILLHEQTHIRRRDYLVKSVAYLIVCVHWFNPLVWLAFCLMSKDMEMSCDEAVIRRIGSEIKQAYTKSLLEAAVDKVKNENMQRMTVFAGSPPSFGEGEVKERVKNVLNYKKPGFWGVLALTVGVIVAAIVMLSDPKVTPEQNKQMATDYGQQEVEQDVSVHESSELQEGMHGTSDSEVVETQFLRRDPWGPTPVYSEDERDAVIAYLQNFGSMTGMERLPVMDDMIALQISGTHNAERWHIFLERTANGEEDAVVFYICDKYPILVYLSYTDGRYYRMEDDSRVYDRADMDGDYLDGSGKYLMGYHREYEDDMAFMCYYLTESEDVTYDDIVDQYTSGTLILDGEGISAVYVCSISVGDATGLSFRFPEGSSWN